MTERPPDDTTEPAPPEDTPVEVPDDVTTSDTPTEDDVFEYDRASDNEKVSDEDEEKPTEPDEGDSTEPMTTRAVDDRPLVPIGLILALAVAVLLVMFAIQNTQMVEVNLFSWSWEAPLILALIGAFIAAVILDETIGLWVRQRRRRRRETREELERLRRRTER